MTQRAIRGRGITSIIIHVVINFIAFDAYNIFFIKNTFKLELHIKGRVSSKSVKNSIIRICTENII